MKNKDKLLNIPNCLCFFRMMLIPVFLVLYFNATESAHYIGSAIILVISGLTDFLDGYIARHYNMITEFGKLIDPIADKLTQLAVAVALLSTYPLMWILVIIIVLKDGMLGIVGLFLYQYGLKMDGSSWCGKIATAYFYFVVVILIAFNVPNTGLSVFLILSSSALMGIAFILYGIQLYQLYICRHDGDKHRGKE